MSITVIIPTFNSARTIGKCLESVGRQTSPSSETIVVDRFSHDEGPEIVRAKGATLLQSKANRSLARNIALQKASSEGVLFIDSDMTLPPTLVQECEIELRKHDALVIPEESVGFGFWAKCKAVERRSHAGDDRLEAARCFRRSALTSLGGYSTALESGEDWDLHNRAVAASLSLGRVNSVIVHDEGRLSMVRLLKKKYGYGKSFRRYLQTNPRVGLVQVNPVRRIVRPSLRAFSSTPKYGVGVLAMTSLGFAAAGLGHMVGQLLGIGPTNGAQ